LEILNKYFNKPILSIPTKKMTTQDNKEKTIKDIAKELKILIKDIERTLKDEELQDKKILEEQRKKEEERIMRVKEEQTNRKRKLEEVSNLFYKLSRIKRYEENEDNNEEDSNTTQIDSQDIILTQLYPWEQEYHPNTYHNTQVDSDIEDGDDVNLISPENKWSYIIPDTPERFDTDEVIPCTPEHV
jgi:hypothetical protein